MRPYAKAAKAGAGWYPRNPEGGIRARGATPLGDGSRDKRTTELRPCGRPPPRVGSDSCTCGRRSPSWSRLDRPRVAPFARPAESPEDIAPQGLGRARGTTL